MPTQTAKFWGKKSDPGEAAAAQSETHLRGRGGAGSGRRPRRSLLSGRALRDLPKSHRATASPKEVQTSPLDR